MEAPTSAAAAFEPTLINKSTWSQHFRFSQPSFSFHVNRCKNTAAPYPPLLPYVRPTPTLGSALPLPRPPPSCWLPVSAEGGSSDRKLVEPSDRRPTPSSKTKSESDVLMSKIFIHAKQKRLKCVTTGNNLSDDTSDHQITHIDVNNYISCLKHFTSINMRQDVSIRSKKFVKI